MQKKRAVHNFEAFSFFFIFTVSSDPTIAQPVVLCPQDSAAPFTPTFFFIKTAREKN